MIKKVEDRFGDSMKQMGYQFIDGKVVTQDKIPVQRWKPNKK